MRFPKIIPMSFNEVLPNKSLLGILKIYIIPNGNNTIGKKIKSCVIINEIIDIIIEIIEAIQIISWDLFGDNRAKESPSIIS